MCYYKYERYDGFVVGIKSNSGTPNILFVLREYKRYIPKKCPYTFEELMTRYSLDND